MHDDARRIFRVQHRYAEPGRGHARGARAGHSRADGRGRVSRIHDAPAAHRESGLRPASYFRIASIAESSLAENARLSSAPTASSTCATLLAPISEDVTCG